MKIRLIRDDRLSDRTIGRMIEDNTSNQICFTLEDAEREPPLPEGKPQWDDAGVRAWKQARITAIPKGVYRLVNTYSRRFQKILPELISVPGFTGVRIHGGNRPENTEGCILVGMSRDLDIIHTCPPALKAIMDLISEAATRKEQTWLEVI